MSLPHLLLLKHLTKLDLFIKSCVNARESLRLKVVCDLKAKISRMAQNKDGSFDRWKSSPFLPWPRPPSVMQSNLYCQRLNRYHNVGFVVAVASSSFLDIITVLLDDWKGF